MTDDGDGSENRELGVEGLEQRRGSKRQEAIERQIESRWWICLILFASQRQWGSPKEKERRIKKLKKKSVE